MRLPKKITPDNIREAVVEVKFESDSSSELFPGIIYEAFDASYTYTNRPLKPAPQNLASPRQELRIQINTQSLLYNDKIIIQIIPNAFIFTCLSKYVGWSEYKLEIEKALNIIEKTKRVQIWTRVGIRYISEYPQKDLRDCTKFQFSFGLPETASEMVAFKSEFSYKEAKVILNLNNHLPLIVQKKEANRFDIIPTSLIDIDVIKVISNLKDIQELLKVLEDVHILEKELYFGLLREDFLETLHPEY
ncbi:MAG: TIGR04255 family protein [Chitinophagaceae bacterium]